MGLVALTIAACGSVDRTGKDVQDRWLSAKCPPTEICGPQRNPETLVIAWLDASKNDLSSVLTKYTSPERSEIIPNYCGAVESYKIDNISVKETAVGENDRSNLKEVTIQGRLEFKSNGVSHNRRTWSILVEEIGGKWFVIDGYH